MTQPTRPLRFRNQPTVDSPLSDLIAGKIDEAEYHRRMQVRRDRDGWQLDPDGNRVTPDRLVRLRNQPRPRRFGCSLWPLVGLVAGVAIWLALILAYHAADPRSAPDPTASRPGDLAAIGSVDASAQAQASASDRELSGAPHEAAGLFATAPSGAPQPRTEAPVPSPFGVTYQGSLAWATVSHGPLYLALREPRGTRVKVCGSAACLTRTSTDFGPIRSLFEAGRIADVSAADFELLCAMTPEQRVLHGLCPGTVSIISRPRTTLPATDTDAIAASGFGMHGAPRLSMSATCRSMGHQAVWVAQTGTAFLDIIQVGTMDGELFYAYGRGTPNGPESLYVERHLGPSGTGPHRYGLELEARVWTLTVDGRTVATIPDTFRTWHLRATQVMAEGDIPFGEASCSLPAGAWRYGGYGPQPRTSIGAASWRVAA